MTILEAMTIWLSATLAVLIQTLFLYSERSRQRRALSKMDYRLLDDIGVTRAAANYETSKPFWRK